MVGRLLREFNIEYHDPAPPQEEMAERVRALLAHGDTIILVAGEPPCGLSVTRFRPGLWSPNLESYLAELYVVPDRRGQGHRAGADGGNDGRRRATRAPTRWSWAPARPT